MKLVTYLKQDTLRAGFLISGGIVDFSEVFDLWIQENSDRPDIPEDVAAFLKADGDVREGAAEIVDRIKNGKQPEVKMLPLEGLRFAPPIPQPSKIICAGLNYYDHCREQNVPIPEQPIFFAKFPSSLIGHAEAISWPPDAAKQVDFEAELAFIIGRPAYRVSEEDALDYVAGYTVMNDVSARDIQFSERQWTRAKSLDTFCPLGPYLVTADEIENPHDLGIRCRLNGELMQDSTTSEMIFSIPYLIARLSQACTLLPGDIISTGTPHGVGVFRSPQVFLKPGDIVEVEIEKIGILRNPVVEKMV